jgi:hypothetical protein
VCAGARPARPFKRPAALSNAPLRCARCARCSLHSLCSLLALSRHCAARARTLAPCTGAAAEVHARALRQAARVQVAARFTTALSNGSTFNGSLQRLSPTALSNGSLQRLSSSPTALSQHHVPAGGRAGRGGAGAGVRRRHGTGPAGAWEESRRRERAVRQQDSALASTFKYYTNSCS